MAAVRRKAGHKQNPRTRMGPLSCVFQQLRPLRTKSVSQMFFRSQHIGTKDLFLFETSQVELKLDLISVHF